MACVKNCKSEDVQFIFVTSDKVSFSLDVFADDEAFISFDSDEAPVNSKRDSKGNLYKSGHSYVVRKFTVKTECSDDAQALERYWRKNPTACGTCAIITNCCDDYIMESVELSEIKVPDIGTEIGSYEFSFEGVPV